jgi:hypothetical protein
MCQLTPVKQLAKAPLHESVSHGYGSLFFYGAQS